MWTATIWTKLRMEEGFQNRCHTASSDSRGMAFLLALEALQRGLMNFQARKPNRMLWGDIVLTLAESAADSSRNLGELEATNELARRLMTECNVNAPSSGKCSPSTPTQTVLEEFCPNSSSDELAAGTKSRSGTTRADRKSK